MKIKEEIKKKVKKREDIENWYDENRDIYKKLIDKVKNIINDVLENEKITVNSVCGRVKEKDSYCNKALKDKYDKHEEEITDLAGLRIITYINSDVDRICKIIEEEFCIDKDNSIDKGASLGIDKVGYKSVHYVGQLKENRSNLSEYKLYKNLKFEVQIRTLLQHAWAEIEHDRNYKFSGVLPKHIKRKFALVAGSLELIDIQFEEIARDIDAYAKEISENTQEGNLNGILIDSTSLKQYLLNKFEKQIKEKYIKPEFGANNASEERIIYELNNFGINTLNELDDMLERYTLNEFKYQTYLSMLRNYMVIDDAEKYFSKCWDNTWSVITNYEVSILEKYNPNISEILAKHHIVIFK